MTDIDRAAREALAKAMEDHWAPDKARRIREGDIGGFVYTGAALDALRAVLKDRAA